MDIENQLISVLQLAYRKHHLDDDTIGWDQLSDLMCDALCEAMGDKGFQGWRDQQPSAKEKSIVPQKRQEATHDEWGDDPYTKVAEDNTFTIGQCYEDIAATTLECRKCGGKEFHVGQGSYYTVIMCVKCRWETCVHDG